ncbi:oleate hydratase [Undibacterium sp. TJN19]|uniref:oleate hydratase n=1 Tax=Undibacterium sp. TJN19 TaxID=3413055 RepID=UPI003BF40FBA
MPKAYLVGAGIASLASAVYLIRDGKMSGNDIHIFEESLQTGGCLDGHGSPETGYVTRGGRMFDEEVYTCTYDLLSSIPSLNNAGKSVKNEIDDFNKKILSNSKSRLVAHGSKIDVSSMGFDNRNRLDLIEIMLQSEESLGTRRIDECFSPSFFETNFWFMWCTTFAFQPWHSAVEFKRYMHRFMHEFPRINTLSGVRRTPLNQYDAITLPVVTWLKAQGVNIHMNSEVTDLDFIFDMNSKTVERLHLIQSGQKTEVTVDSDDKVFVTIGSMVAGSSFGSMTSAPVLKTKEAGGAWSLWEKIAKDQTEFGRPSVFSDRIPQSTWESFTVTFKDPLFFKLMESFTGNEAGTGGLVTFKDSNWLMSVVLAYQPHFIGQPAGVTVCWGDGLFPDKLGNFVHKKMSDCTGAEILTELCSHLGFIADLPLILETSICIPCLMPFIGSQFLTRAKGDRPFVIPPGSENLAFIGQYCEIPDDTVFTVEYSVRSAQIAVYSLLNLDKEVCKLYRGSHDLSVIYHSFKTMLH